MTKTKLQSRQKLEKIEKKKLTLEENFIKKSNDRFMGQDSRIETAEWEKTDNWKDWTDWGKVIKGEREYDRKCLLGKNKEGKCGMKKRKQTRKKNAKYRQQKKRKQSAIEEKRQTIKEKAENKIEKQLEKKEWKKDK